MVKMRLSTVGLECWTDEQNVIGPILVESKFLTACNCEYR